MSSLSKIIAGVLLAAGLVLAFVAWRLASAPSSPPQPVAPVAASAGAGEVLSRGGGGQGDPGRHAHRAGHAGSGEVAGGPVGRLSGGRPAHRRDRAHRRRRGRSHLAVHAGAWHGQPAAPGERALAVAVDEVAAIASCRAISSMCSSCWTRARKCQARLLQSQLRVLAYGANSLDGPEEKSLLQQGAPAQPAKTAVLAVPVERVSELMLASRAGRLQLALRPLGDAGVPDIALFPQPRGDAGARRPDARTELLDSGPSLWRRHPAANGRHHAVAAPGRARVGRRRTQRRQRRQIRARALLNPAAAGCRVQAPETATII